MNRDVPSEMDIVDTFTHLIFCGAGALSEQETSILRVLRLVDENAAQSATADANGEVGYYLKALNVAEMIQLVAKVREYYLLQGPPAAQTQSPDARHQPSRF